MRIVFFIVIASILGFSGCIEPQNAYSKIPPGTWRGVLYLSPSELVSGDDDETVSRVVDNSNELPFNFEVVYDNEKDFYIVIHNAEERILVDDIEYGRDRTTAKDTLRINFPIFDTYISAVTEEKVMEGYWHVNYKENYKIQFKATHGDTTRFKKGLDDAQMDISGKWDITFDVGQENPYPAIGVFKQNGNHLTGTFQTETGDYRYLEGTVINKKAFLSCFDGSHAFLFEAKDLGDGELNGVFKSGTHYTSPFVGKKNDQAKIGDPFELNQVVNPEEPMDFSFPNSEGKMITLQDERYQDKSKIVMIMGTWCPNCKDASNFLDKFMQSPEAKDIEIISIVFERYKEAEKNLSQIKKYKEKSGVPWEVLLGGNYVKSEASKAMPQLDQILSYPTMLFLDKDNYIKGVHTGFSGPATEDFNSFKNHFYNIIDQL
jgi:thiol-disulfide isomerase/thioredoxin